jgi:hypothetical protein
MTTLTVYFALSPMSTSSSLTSTPKTIQPFRMISSITKPIPISLPNITLPSPLSSLSTPTRRTSLKRNKTFFERFNQTLPSQQSEPSNPSPEPAIRLRRRFTFRRSLRQSTHSKGGDIDDGIRSVFFIFI